jgi:hypothetical protein
MARGSYTSVYVWRHRHETLEREANVIKDVLLFFFKAFSVLEVLCSVIIAVSATVIVYPYVGPLDNGTIGMVVLGIFLTCLIIVATVKPRNQKTKRRKK